MKLLGVRVARSVWIVPPYFINPTGKYIRPLVEIMKEKYQFHKTPLDAPIPPPPDTGYRFESGMFNGKNGAVQIVSMAIHDDGVVIDTRSSTDDADAFMEEVIALGNEKFHLPKVSEIPIRRLYNSELNVLFEKLPALINPKLLPILKDFSSAIGEGSVRSDVLSLHLATNRRQSEGMQAFRIEREANTLAEENRFWTFSPTPTSIHLDLLLRLEELAT